jgi:threonine synthase
MELIMTKCLSCGHIHGDLELNCPECGSFYSKIIDDFSPNEEVEKMNSPLNKITHEIEIEKNNLKKISTSFVQRFVQLFR